MSIIYPGDVVYFEGEPYYAVDINKKQKTIDIILPEDFKSSAYHKLIRVPLRQVSLKRKITGPNYKKHPVRVNPCPSYRRNPRTIGRKNIQLVRRAVRRAIKMGVDNYSDIVSYAIGILPLKLWDTWEGADQEIRDIIDNEFF